MLLYLLGTGIPHPTGAPCTKPREPQNDHVGTYTAMHAGSGIPVPRYPVNLYSREMPVLRATVYGVVQGVGFRWYVRGRALRHGLTGRAANRPDGAVDVEAEGDRESLERFLDSLREGPGRVARVEHVLADGTLDADDFTME